MIAEQYKAVEIRNSEKKPHAFMREVQLPSHIYQGLNNNHVVLTELANSNQIISSDILFPEA